MVGDVGVVDEHDSTWLLEQNAWLMEELESKDGEEGLPSGVLMVDGRRGGLFDAAKSTGLLVTFFVPPSLR